MQLEGKIEIVFQAIERNGTVLHLFCEAHVSVDDGGTIQTKPPCNMTVRESEVKGSV